MNMLKVYPHVVLVRFIAAHFEEGPALRSQLDMIYSTWCAERIGERMQEVAAELEQLRGKTSAPALRRRRLLRREVKQLQQRLERVR